MKCILLALSFLMLLSSCGENSGGRSPRYRGYQENYNYNTYTPRSGDYYNYNGNRYNYNWNAYANQWMSVQGTADVAYCGYVYMNYATGTCYQSCQQRKWVPYTGVQTGLVWGCDFYRGCRWRVAQAARTWYSYTWVPYYRVAACY